MTNHTGRMYALALGLVVFFVAWAAVAARPWQSTAPDPRLQALAVRQAQLQRDAGLVKQIVSRQVRGQAAKPTAAPSVRIVNLPPLTITRTS
jgi:hypothetical protein